MQIAVMTKPPRDMSHEQCVMPLRPDKGQVGAPVTVLCNRFKTSINDRLPLYHYDIHISSIGGAPPSSSTEREGRKVRPRVPLSLEQLSTVGPHRCPHDGFEPLSTHCSTGAWRVGLDGDVIARDHERDHDHRGTNA